MISEQTKILKRSVMTPSGQISYLEAGDGPVALFVHGVLLNSYLWRHQLEELSSVRRCIAVDLLAHGDTELASSQQNLSLTANANMLREFIDATEIDQVDLVGNDTGGGIAQIFAALHPSRVRTLTLTNCDAHNNCPPEAAKPLFELAAAGKLPELLNAMLADKTVFRSPQAFGAAYERPERLDDATVETYLRPLVRSEERMAQIIRFLTAYDCQDLMAVESRLRQFIAPTLIVWGTDDVFFDTSWSQWLANKIPGTRKRVELPGARLFFPEERALEFNRELRAHWLAK